jgi:hypothetical protein
MSIPSPSSSGLRMERLGKRFGGWDTCDRRLSTEGVT